MNVSLPRVVAAAQVALGVALAVSNVLAGDAAGAAPWAVVAAIGVLYVRLFRDAQPERL
ncbi:hypothetical protein [Candidatus Halobonum tyrrellensis]|uniref:hypothetical protein n=1 Tax=Candidatus Halobonum tyrrellensis TaxID=1431545 RepID=UPI001378EF5F|nr:hypothetical protein [Candidatus Halobonum tyrrellensis]